MEIFVSNHIEEDFITLDDTETRHCIKVLRHKPGDIINVVDGVGTMYVCRIVSFNTSSVCMQILERHKDWGGHPYKLTMAVCPTKNEDRYEWFAEKSCEIGIDNIVPVIGEHSQRRNLKTNRIKRILVSAMKQSLKSSCPYIAETISVENFIRSTSEKVGQECEAELKMIAYCFDEEVLTDSKKLPKISIRQALEKISDNCRKITVLIGPEGDFSAKEVRLAMDQGFIPIHLGKSRLRTETAALTAVVSVYERFMT